MNTTRRLCHILAGPAIMALTIVLLSNSLTLPGAQATGILFWMVLWWITRPVHIAVTAFVPVIVNAFLNIVPMGSITSQYASDSIILIFGSGLLCLPWAAIGLDRRIALKVLSIIGPSMKSQVTVWLVASVLTSCMLPNVAVCALFTPMAVAMLAAAGYDDIRSSPPAVPILLAIGWGVGIGGLGSPLGGAMNLAAISLFEEHIGHEFMYVDWLTHITPFFVIITLVTLLCMLMMPMKVKNLNGTKSYFENSYRELGPMKRDEKICAGLFLLALLGAFTRPVYAALLPALTPAYIYLVLGCLCFVIITAEKKFLLTWETAEKETMWGMMFLFGGGLALGKLMNESGASAGIADLVAGMSLDGGLLTIVVFVVFARAMSEFTNSTTSAAITIPIVLGFTTKLGLNPVPWWFITIMAYNAEFMLPISVRAIPVAYGLDAKKMLKGGIPMAVINMLAVIIFGYGFMKLWPAFSQLPYVLK